MEYPWAPSIPQCMPTYFGANMNIESKMFQRLPELYPTDVVNLFINFRFLDDIFFKWREGFDTPLLHGLFEDIDPHIKFSFENFSTEQHFLSVKCSIAGNTIILTFTTNQRTPSHI